MYVICGFHTFKTRIIVMEMKRKTSTGPTCAAVGCSNNRTNELISLHRFPFSNNTLLEKWENMVGRKNWKPYKYSVLCSDHFEDGCYRKSVIMGQFTSRNRLLKKDAVPTLFSYRNSEVKRSIPKQRYPTEVFGSNFHQEVCNDEVPYREQTKLEMKRRISTGPTCAAVGCSNNRTNNNVNAKSFHRFPFSNNTLLEKWENMVRRKNWKPSKYSVLCSDHFEDGCYRNSVIMGQFTSRYRLLKNDAVPTLFSCRNSEVKRRSPKEHYPIEVFGSNFHQEVCNDEVPYHEQTKLETSNQEIAFELEIKDHCYGVTTQTKSVEVQTDLSMNEINQLQNKLKILKEIQDNF